MKYRTFPGTGVTVSEVGFGTWTISTGWWGEKTDAEAVGMLRRALDEHGVTFFDAADAYGNGRAEKQIAEAFRGRRSEIVIGTKVGYDIYDEAAVASRRGQQELPMRTDPQFLRFAVDKCLERLETDYIDVLQIHNAKMEHVRDAELWGTLRDLKREGKIRAWGVSNFDTRQMEDLFRVPDGKRCATNQVQYSLKNRRIERDVLPWCQEHNVPVMAYSPLGGGGSPLTSDRTLAKIGSAHGCSPAAVALAWAIRRGNVIAIPESGTPAHTKENAEALSTVLTPADLQALNTAYPGAFGAS